MKNTDLIRAKVKALHDEVGETIYTSCAHSADESAIPNICIMMAKEFYKDDNTSFTLFVKYLSIYDNLNVKEQEAYK